VLVGVGGLEPRKGFDRLLEAFAGLSDPSARLLIVGSGPEGERLRALAAELGVAERVRWMGQRDDVPDILFACDLFVLSSQNEGMAVAMLEAMALGLLVVGTPVSGVREAIGSTADRDAAGWVASAPTTAALRDAIEAALDALRRGEPAEHRRREAIYRVRNWFNEERMVDEVEALVFGPSPWPDCSAGAARS
jgi:glycosyltransferase involved in cell wall biosynthesis